ncbi:hypothetical protein [Sporomusa silvacetica]|uniref:hypothetical protein n=1 Tax=Sporomusa silvacetica TaxID=55504 RepID=UPI000B99DBED|nr:hypothetical protein [Sporomusa silvacetica]
MLAAAVKQAHVVQIQPVVHFQAPTVEVAAQDIAKRISAKNTTLPPAALADSDRTGLQVILALGEREYFLKKF